MFRIQPDGHVLFRDYAVGDYAQVSLLFFISFLDSISWWRICQCICVFFCSYVCLAGEIRKQKPYDL